MIITETKIRRRRTW